MTELNELFEQIFHCERNFKERTDQLKALNIQIEEYQSVCEKTKNELHTKQKELAVKNSKLADVDMEVKLLQLKKNIIQSQKDNLLESNCKISKEFDVAIGEVAITRESFIDTLRKFSRSYDLHGSGVKYREEEAKKQIELLQDELILLETEMVELESYLDDIKKLQKKLNQAECELQQEKDREKDLRAKQLEQEKLIQQLKKEKKSGNNSSDLKRLQADLDACKNSHEEETCKRLKKELEDLQKECYHEKARLQIARQNKNTSAASSITRNPAVNSDTRSTVSSNENSVDDEWLWTMEDFENAEGEMFKEDDWNINESELDLFEQDLFQTSPSVDVESLGKKAERAIWSKRNLPPANFTQHRRLYEPSANNVALPNDFQAASNLPDSSTSNPLKRTGEWSKTASPDSKLVPRKRPGESIFRAPGIQSSVKKVKKVRFHY